MIARKILLFLGLCLVLVASIAAPSQPATQTDIQQLQQQIQVLDKEVTVFKEVASNRLDAQDKRVGDLGLWTNQQANHMGAISNLSTIVGIGITVITIAVGFFAYISATRKAVTEAQKAVREWFQQNNATHTKQIEDLEKSRDEIKIKLALFQENAAELQAEADGLRRVLAELKAASQNIQQSMHQEADSVKTTAQQIREDMQRTAESSTNKENEPFQSPEIPQAEITEAINAPDPHLVDANDLLQRAIEQKDHEKAIATYEILEDRYGEDTALSIRKLTAQGVFGRGYRFAQLGRLEDAIKAYDLVDQRYGNDEARSLRFAVTTTLFNKALILEQMNRSEEAIQVYELIDQRYGSDDYPALREQVAKALRNKGIMLGQLNRGEEEIQVYDLLDQRYGHDKSPALREQVAKALFSKGITLSLLNRHEDAIQVHNLIEQRYGRYDSPALRAQVAKALLYKCITLGKLNRKDEATKTCEQVIQQYTSDSDPEIKKLVERAKDLLNELRGSDSPEAEFA